MVRLSALLDVRCIQLEMQATKKKEAIAELVTLLEHAGKISQTDAIINTLLDQEKAVSTGIGEGIAIPHELLDQCAHSLLAIGRKKEGLAFHAIDHQPVFLVFLLLGSRHKPTEHLQILSKLSRWLHDSQFKNTLLHAQTPEDVIAVFRTYEMNE